MKSKMAEVLCLIGLTAICGMAVAGTVDPWQILGSDGDAPCCTGSVSLDLETAAASPARVEKTGQTTSYGPRDDGALQKGIAWPTPRFTDHGNGTVKDNLTGLIWLKNANCEKFWADDTTGENHRNWKSALVAANKLRNGYCGLADGSKAGQWRLPNIRELQSLVDFGFWGPALPNTAGTGQWTEGDPFSGVLHSYYYFYWSSTTLAYYTDGAWQLGLGDGMDRSCYKTDAYFVWPVRGGQ